MPPGGTLLQSRTLKAAGPKELLSPSVVIADPSGGIDAWAASTHYPVNYLVTNGGNTYICKVDHTSGSTFSGESGDWQQIGGSGSGSGNTSSSVVALGSMGASQTVNLASTADQIVYVTGTLTANCTVTISNLAAACVVRLLILQNGTGGYTLTISDGTHTQSVSINSAASSFSEVDVSTDGTNLYCSSLSVPGPVGPAGPTGSTGAAGAAGATGASAALQNGVLNSGDALISSISINNSTGALTFTLASGNVYVTSAGGVLTAVSYTGNSYTPAATVPASTKYAVVGVEMDTSGAITLVKGTDSASAINTGSLIASNTPATSSGKIRLADIAIFNNSGTYHFGDNTSTPTQGTNWIDRRPWARGFSAQISDGNSGTKTMTASANTQLPNLEMRMEIGNGNQVMFSVNCFSLAGATTGQLVFSVWLNGASSVKLGGAAIIGGSGQGMGVAAISPFGISAGSYQVIVDYYSTQAYTWTGGTFVLNAQEFSRQNTTNGAS